MTPLSSLAEIEKHVLDTEAMQSDLCLLEYNGKKATLSGLNSFMQVVYKRVGKNGLFGCLFCSANNSVLYLNGKV